MSNRVFVESGRRGARARWGPEPRVVRLDDLTGPQRRLVLALVEAAKKETTASDVETLAASAEGHGNDRSDAA